jgi:hypothetical protein
MVEISGFAVEADADAISALLEIFIMERLV